MIALYKCDSSCKQHTSEQFIMVKKGGNELTETQNLNNILSTLTFFCMFLAAGFLPRTLVRASVSA